MFWEFPQITREVDVKMSFCCRAEPIIIRCGTSTVFFMFDSYVQPTLSSLITNQGKIFICGNMTVVIKFKVKTQFCLSFQIKKLDRKRNFAFMTSKGIKYICMVVRVYYFHVVINPITWGGGLFGPDHQIIDHNSKTALSSTSKLGDF